MYVKIDEKVFFIVLLRIIMLLFCLFLGILVLFVFDNWNNGVI